MYKIDPEKIRKYKFVQMYIQPMLQYLDRKITTVSYIYDEERGEESVVVYHGTKKVREICVTADSMAAVAYDVIKKISEI